MYILLDLQTPVFIVCIFIGWDLSKTRIRTLMYIHYTIICAALSGILESCRVTFKKQWMQHWNKKKKQQKKLLACYHYIENLYWFKPSDVCISITCINIFRRVYKQNYSHAISGPEFKRRVHLKIMGTAKILWSKPMNV